MTTDIGLITPELLEEYINDPASRPEAMRAHPDLVAVLDAAQDPLGMFDLRLRGPLGHRRSLGWVTAEAGLFLTQETGGWSITVTSVNDVPAAVFGLTGTPAVTTPQRQTQHLDHNPLLTVLGDDDSAAKDALNKAGWTHVWTLDYQTPDEEWLMAAACTPSGTWLLEPTNGAWDLKPVRADEILRRLASTTLGLLMVEIANRATA